MKIKVDFDVCVSTAACMQACPQVFEVRDDYGVETAAQLRITVTKGEGENITTTVRTQSLAGQGAARLKRFSAALDLAREGLAQGGDQAGIIRQLMKGRRIDHPHRSLPALCRHDGPQHGPPVKPRDRQATRSPSRYTDDPPRQKSRQKSRSRWHERQLTGWRSGSHYPGLPIPEE